MITLERYSTFITVHVHGVRERPAVDLEQVDASTLWCQATWEVFRKLPGCGRPVDQELSELFTWDEEG